MNAVTTTAPAFANRYDYSDIVPFEIVRVISDTTIEIRELHATIDPTWKMEWVAGGFAGTCLNNDSQRWVFASDENAPVIRIRKTKRGWSHKGDRFQLAASPVKHYDFNF
jgi:hypothetical protein